MPLAVTPNLLDPSSASPFTSSVEWINAVLFGQIALGLCVLAVAFVGAQMLTGRLALRQGIRVVLGCFILLGAPVIAAAFMWSTGGESEPLPSPPSSEEFPAREDLPPANRDPYSGA